MAKILTYSPGHDGVLMMLDGGKVMHLDKQKICMVWEKYGGSFVQALGLLLSKADAPNTVKILRTWENYVREYFEGGFFQ